MKSIVISANRPGAGKDTLALIAVEQGYMQFSFAEPLKNSIRMLYSLSEEEINDRVLKETIIPRLGKSPRTLMCDIGKVLREYDPDIFSRDLIHNIQGLSEWIADPVVVISDLRYINELDRCKEEGMVHIHINRPYEPGQEAVTHESEAQADYFHSVCDILILNHNTLEEYRAQCHRIVSELTY